MEIAFLPAPDEGGLYRDTVQRDLNALTRQLSGPGISHRGFAQDAVDAAVINLGEIIVKLGVAVIAGIAPIGVAWIHGRAGRKVRLKVGDLEAEAGTVAEVEGLITLAQRMGREALARSTTHLDPS